MIKVDQIYPLLELAYRPEVRESVVYLLLGEPGIGKTQIVRQFAKDKGVKVVTLLCSQQLPNEIVGTHAPDLGGRTMKYYPPSWFYELEDGDILFLDEMFTAPKSVLSAMLTMVESRILQNRMVLPDVMIVAAANPVGSPALIDAPIRDRFQVVEVETDRHVAAEYLAVKYGGRPERLVNLIAKTSNATWNEFTPRTVEKLLIQMNAIASDDEVDAAEESVISDIYGQVIWCDLVAWHNDRIDKLKNKKFHDAVDKVNIEAEADVFVSIKEAARTALKTTASPAAELKKAINAELENYADREEATAIRAYLNDEDYTIDVDWAVDHNLMTKADYVENAAIDKVLNDAFEDADLSTVIGTLKDYGIWDNVQEILEGIKLVDVEV